MKSTTAFDITKLIRVSLFAIACVWATVAVVYLILFHSFVAVIIAALLCADAVIFSWLSFVIARKNKWIYYGTLLFLFGNILLTIFDEFGWADLIALIFECAIFVLLLAGRKKLLAPSE